MILFELGNQDENDPVYRQLAFSNYARQFEFLRSLVDASLASETPFLSQTVIKALNYHAMACLHSFAGEYRPCEVDVGEYEPPQHYRVDDLMDDFVNQVNRQWQSSDAILLSSYVLWRLNHIHPFVNGNGRTARAACYFVLCVKSGGWLGGEKYTPYFATPEQGGLYRSVKISRSGGYEYIVVPSLKTITRTDGIIVSANVDSTW